MTPIDFAYYYTALKLAEAHRNCAVGAVAWAPSEFTIFSERNPDANLGGAPIRWHHVSFKPPPESNP